MTHNFSNLDLGGGPLRDPWVPCGQSWKVILWFLEFRTEVTPPYHTVLLSYCRESSEWAQAFGISFIQWLLLKIIIQCQGIILMLGRHQWIKQTLICPHEIYILTSDLNNSMGVLACSLVATKTLELCVKFGPYFHFSRE